MLLDSLELVEAPQSVHFTMRLRISTLRPGQVSRNILDSVRNLARCQKNCQCEAVFPDCCTPASRKHSTVLQGV